MNPFLESAVWEDFHHEFLSAIRHQLVPQVQPRYETRVELRVYVEIPEEPVRSIRPDVLIHDTGGTRGQAAEQATAILEPVIVTLLLPEEMQEPYLTIREAETDEIVTIVELLSPTNKRQGAGRGEYLTKRNLILRSHVHLVELDLLRGGERLPALEPLPAADYFAFVSRGDKRPKSELYAWQLRELLPSIPIPLAKGDQDATLDLKAALDEVFERARYRLQYDRPLQPPLGESDEVWMSEQLKSSNP